MIRYILFSLIIGFLLINGTASAQNLCAKIISAGKISKLLPFTYPKPKLVRQFKKLLDKDSRLAWQKVSKFSEEMDLVDNFSSPATLHDFILHEKIEEQDLLYLRSLIERPSTITSFASSRGLLIKPHQARIIEAIETKYRIAAEMLRLASVEKKQEIKISDEEYLSGLIKVYHRIFSELNEKRMSRDFLPEELTHLLKADNFNKYNLENNSLSSYFSHTPFGRIFKSDFYKGFTEKATFFENYKYSAAMLSEYLSELPVGISYRVAELTSTIRFGEQHFYGNYNSHIYTTRSAYKHKAIRGGGMAEVELNIPNRKKKTIAILLDRSHQALDRVFGLKNKDGWCLNTCGSFAPILLMRGGVPVISPFYGTPTTPILSLAIQKYLGFPNVKSFKLNHMSPVDGIIDIPIIFIHDGVGGIVELGIYVGLLSYAGSVIYSLF